MRRISVFAILLLAASCVGPPETKPVPVAGPAPIARPMPAPNPAVPDWIDQPLTPGDWRYAENDAFSYAIFGLAKGKILSFICHRQMKRVSIDYDVPEVMPDSKITIRTSSTVRSDPVVGNESSPSADVYLPPNDPLLDAIAFTRGRFMVSLSEYPNLIVPAAPEISRVIEDCRAG